VRALDIPAAGATTRSQDVLGRSVVLLAVAVPLLVVCAAGGERPLGTLTLGIYVAVATLLVACEHWVAYDGAWGSALQGTRTDVTYVVLATLMDKGTFLVCITAIAAVGQRLAERIGLGLWPSGWSFPLQVAAGLVVADAATYLRHRLAHASSILWRFHRIHHSMTELYWIRSAYTHPLEQLTILAAIMLPIALLGAGAHVVAVVAFVFGLSGLVQHANVDARSSVLNWVFATPEVHRLHHSADEGCHTNFSAFFVWMDLLFGTYDRPTRSTARVRVGLGDVGSFPKDFLSHLAMPFRRETSDERGEPAWNTRREIATAKEP
jgi:sterol desaturase/sphingolipid hydroxylase (fatty acid hydroxylase superfamily)